MLLSEELSQLRALHQQGALSADEYSRAKSRLLEPGAPIHHDGPPQALAALNAMRRSRSERWMAGVCGGLSAATGMAPWLARLGFVLLALFGGAGVLVYLLFWLFVPLE